jgi:hypothetical protein
VCGWCPLARRITHLLGDIPDISNLPFNLLQFSNATDEKAKQRARARAKSALVKQDHALEMATSVEKAAMPSVCSTAGFTAIPSQSSQLFVPILAVCVTSLITSMHAHPFLFHI